MSHCNYAVLLEKLKRYDEAEEHYGLRTRPLKKALEFKPRYTNACAGLGDGISQVFFSSGFGEIVVS